MILWINGYRVSAKTRAVLVLPYLFESILVHATETSCTVLTYRMHFCCLQLVFYYIYLYRTCNCLLNTLRLCVLTFRLHSNVCYRTGTIDGMVLYSTPYPYFLRSSSAVVGWVALFYLQVRSECPIPVLHFCCLQLVLFYIYMYRTCNCLLDTLRLCVLPFRLHSDVCFRTCMKDSTFSTCCSHTFSAPLKL